MSARDDDRPLWWDDASYAAYQAHDPYADDDPYAARHLTTIHTADLCNGERGGIVGHAETCERYVPPAPF